MADLPLLGDELRRRMALERDRQLGIDPGAGNDRGYAFNQWLPVSTNKVGSASWVQQGADPKPAVPEALQGGLLGGADLLDSTRTGKLTPEALGSLLTGSTLSGGLLAPKGSLASGGSIKAYHGSPHDFDKFTFENIGGGEGAQAYGHGLYFAGNEEVARSYKRAGDHASRQVDVINGKLSQLAREMDQYHGGEYGKYTDPKGYELKAQYDALMQKRSDLGHMYEVNINADPQKFLDWDKPLSGQSPQVREAVRAAKGDRPVQLSDDLPGQLAYYRLGNQRLQSPEASAALTQQGIPGIKYLDQGSRNISQQVDDARAGLEYWKRSGDADKISLAERVLANAQRMSEKGSSNYVVFPTQEEIIQILRKYGLAAPSPVVPGAQGAPSTPGLLSDQQSEIPMKDRVY